MLTLDHHIELDAAALASPNLCSRFTADDLKKIGAWVCEGYERDEQSRFKWKRRMQAALDLAMQVQKEKSFPWPGCANIAFPLTTIGALQFHSRAYPALIQTPNPVKMRVVGDDPTGTETAAARRVSTHMSWQCLEEDSSWEEEKDRLLIVIPIVGCAFGKVYRDGDKRHTVTETVLAQDFVVDYWTKSLESCPRKTHLIPFSRNRVHSAIKRGTFRDVSEEPWYGTPPQRESDPRRDTRVGQAPVKPDEVTPYLVLEQHVDLDLDGDGYAEPYIISVEEDSQCVLRIVSGVDEEGQIQRNSRGEIIAIQRTEYFIKYPFIPSPDGGFYELGFGVLLGPLNESTNTIINQLVDAGTWSMTGGGFLTRGAKVHGGNYSFAPYEWKRVDSGGDDLRKSIFPLQGAEPSAVLFQLLSLLINYVERISGTTDPMVGENPGQNTTAETMRTMVQEGQRIFSAIFKRVWRAMKEEFKLRYALNRRFAPLKRSFGEGQMVLSDDYQRSEDSIVPAADPNVISDQMRLTQVQLLKAAAASTPGYDLAEVERRYLEALKIEAIEKVYPGVEKTGAPKDTKLQIAELNAQVDQMKLQAEQQRFMMEMQEQARMNTAEIVKIMAEIESTRETLRGDVADRQIGILNALVGLAKTRQEVMIKKLEAMMKAMEVRDAGTESGSVHRLAIAPGNGAVAESSAPAEAAAA